MYYLKAKEGMRWSTKDGSMIFSNVICLSDKTEMTKYILIDKDGAKADMPDGVAAYLVEEK